VAPLDAAAIRGDFPALADTPYGKPLVYLDSAASTQRPRAVIDALVRHYETVAANVHRGVYDASVRATEAYEGARENVRAFLGAAEAREIVFVRGTTEGINLVAQSWGRANVRAGDEIIVTQLEHHSNIVPWQLLCEQTGARLRVAPIDTDGDVIVDTYRSLFGPRTRLVALAHVSNAIGTINPVADLVAIAHERGVPVLVDGAQAIAHMSVDVRALGADFYVFSGHKIYGPTGIGALYARRELLEDMPPYQGGGDMIASVTFEKTTYNSIPYRFEAGTPHITGAVGLAAALDYVRSLGFPAIAAHEDDVLAYLVSSLAAIPGVSLVGTPRRRASVVSFMIDGVHPHDVGTILDREGIAIRAGHHCSQPLMQFYGVPATNRASLAVYSSREDVDRLVAGVEKVKEVFA
jgi:cysteine desulfurase/selenocysteine lyase